MPPEFISHRVAELPSLFLRQSRLGVLSLLISDYCHMSMFRLSGWQLRDTNKRGGTIKDEMAAVVIPSIHPTVRFHNFTIIYLPQIITQE